jgi:HTH-type transcriptional regulator / antitoxin HigA
VHRVPYVSNEAFPPGDALRDRIEELGMSQADLAARTNLSTKHINQMVQGIAPITHETALILERVTGTPARIWNVLEAAYREAAVRSNQSEPSADDLKWLRAFPTTELQKRGLIPHLSPKAELFQSVLAFFGVADRVAWERVWLKPAASFRRSRVFQSHPEATAAWLRIGEIEGRARNCQPFDARGFRQALLGARGMTRQDHFSDDLVAACAGAGVALVFVREIPGCRANGAARWLTPSKALIQLSDRHKREDAFWFSFFHEGGHVLNHPKREMFVDDGNKDTDSLEEEADQFAEDILIPPAKAEELPSLKTSLDVKRFASEVGIAEGIVVGRLHNDKKWLWSEGNNLIRKVQIVDTSDE